MLIHGSKTFSRGARSPRRHGPVREKCFQTSAHPESEAGNNHAKSQRPPSAVREGTCVPHCGQQPLFPIARDPPTAASSPIRASGCPAAGGDIPGSRCLETRGSSRGAHHRVLREAASSVSWRLCTFRGRASYCASQPGAEQQRVVGAERDRDPGAEQRRAAAPSVQVRVDAERDVGDRADLERDAGRDDPVQQCAGPRPTGPRGRAGRRASRRGRRARCSAPTQLAAVRRQRAARPRSAIAERAARSPRVRPRRSSLDSPKPTTPRPAYWTASRARVRASSGCRVRLAAMTTAMPSAGRARTPRATASRTRSVNARDRRRSGRRTRSGPPGSPASRPPSRTSSSAASQHQTAYVVLGAQHRPGHVVEPLEAEPALLVGRRQLRRPLRRPARPAARCRRARRSSSSVACRIDPVKCRCRCAFGSASRVGLPAERAGSAHGQEQSASRVMPSTRSSSPSA